MKDLVSLDEMDAQSRTTFEMALGFTFATATLVLKRKGDKNILPFVHILLSFLLSLTNICSLDARIETSYVTGAILKAVPVKELCGILIHLIALTRVYPDMKSRNLYAQKRRILSHYQKTT
jgi:hypothetical protein